MTMAGYDWNPYYHAFIIYLEADTQSGSHKILPSLLKQTEYQEHCQARSTQSESCSSNS